MRIEIFGDGIDRSSINLKNHKITCRSVVEKDGKILTVYFNKTDHYNLPGGGLEKDETLKECCVRETLEETGYHIEVLAETVTVMEYYPDSTWETHYYRCELINDKNHDTVLTEEEQLAQMETRWVELYHFLEILESSPTNHLYGQNIHERELIGLLNSL